MAADRGGLNYKIVIRDSFSVTTKKFRDELTKSKQAFAEFSAGAAADSATAESLRASADAARATAAANRQLAASTRERTREAKKAKEIDDLVIEAGIRAERSRAIQNRADQVGIDLKRKIVKQLTVEAEAQKKAAQFIRNKTVLEQRNQILAAAGIQASKQKAKALTLEEEAAKRVEKRIRALQVAELARNAISARTQGPAIDDVERAAVDRVEAALKRKAIAERTAQIAEERGVQIGKQKAKILTIEEAAIKKVEAATRRSAISARVDAIQNNQRVGPRLADGSFFSRNATQEASRFKNLLKQTNNEGNSLLFTFRRLFGILAAFTVARLAVQGFLGVIKEGLDFNSKIAEARIGIGGLIAATAEARDQFGKLLTPAQQIVNAEKEAVKQVELLRQAGLSTTATFDQLLETFQVAIAPGLAGGLTIDEVRKLAVDVSQAATVLGIAQNQLSEEIRNVIQGTGQLRTTRLLALVSNEEITRAREAGTLFALLTQRLGGFNEAAEKAARSTLPGLLNRIKQVLQAGLGEASKQLFGDVLKVGNLVFEKVLTIKDQFGLIHVNPQVVAILNEIFSALRDIFAEVVLAGRELGFDGARAGVRAFAQALRVAGQVAAGVLRGMFTAFTILNTVVRTFSSLIGVSNSEFAKFAGTIASIVTPLLLIKSLLGSMGINLKVINTLLGPTLIKNIVGAGKAFLGAFLVPLASALAAVGLVVFAFNQVAEAIFGVNLSLKDTVDLLGLGLAGAFQSAITFVTVAFQHVSNFFRDSFEAIVNFGTKALRESKLFIATIKGDLEEVQRITTEGEASDLARDNKARAQAKTDAEEIARIKELGSLTQLELEKKIAAVAGDAAGKDAQGPGFNVPNVDFDKFLKGLDDVKVSLADDNSPTFLSTVRQEVQQIEDEMKTLADDIRKAKAEFASVVNKPVVEGLAGQIEDIFRAQVADSAEKAHQITLSILNTQKKIADLQNSAGPLTADQETQRQGQLNTLIEEEKILLEARNQLDVEGNKLATTRAAIIAVRETPAIKIANDTLRQRLAAEQAIARSIRGRATDAAQNVLQAKLALQAAVLENQQRQRAAQLELAVLRVRASGAKGEEKVQLDGLVSSLQQQLSLNQGIAAAQEDQLRHTLEMAQLVQNGSITQGLREGLVQLASELPTFFEAGVNIAKSAVQSFSSFLSGAIVAAFDPSQNTSFAEALGHFLQSLAQTILDNLIQAAIGQLIGSSLGLDTGAVTLQAAATTLATVVPGLQAAASTLAAAAIGLSGASSLNGLSLAPFVGLHKGGPVTHRRARGYDGGGRIRPGFRPKGLHHTDTIPIWAAPGEFMIRAAAVRKIGLEKLHALNQGLVDPMSLVSGIAPVMRSAPSVPGYADGGLISDKFAAQTASGGSGGAGSMTVVPTLVAREGELARILAGGHAALLKHIRENSSDINAALDRKQRNR